MKRLILFVTIVLTAGICAGADLQMVESPTLADLQGEWTGSFVSESRNLTDKTGVVAFIRDDVMTRGKIEMKLVINDSYIGVSRSDPSAGNRSQASKRKRPYPSFGRFDHQDSISETYRLYRKADGTPVLKGEVLPAPATPWQWMGLCERRGRILSLGTYTLVHNALQEKKRSESHKKDTGR